MLSGPVGPRGELFLSVLRSHLKGNGKTPKQVERVAGAVAAWMEARSARAAPAVIGRLRAAAVAAFAEVGFPKAQAEEFATTLDNDVVLFDVRARPGAGAASAVLAIFDRRYVHRRTDSEWWRTERHPDLWGDIPDYPRTPARHPIPGPHFPRIPHGRSYQLSARARQATKPAAFSALEPTSQRGASLRCPDHLLGRPRRCRPFAVPGLDFAVRANRRRRAFQPLLDRREECRAWGQRGAFDMVSPSRFPLGLPMAGHFSS